MPVLNYNKIRTPAGSDGYDLTTDLRLMALSMGVLIPVANEADRDQALADAITAGITVSPTSPVIVRRGDTRTIEANDGTGWVAFRDDKDTGWIEPTTWGLSYNTNSTFRTRKVGDYISWKGRFMPPSGFITTGTTSPVAVLPSGHFDPTADRYYASTSWVAGATPPYRADGVVQVSTSGNVYLHVQANTTAVYVDGECHRVD